MRNLSDATPPIPLTRNESRLYSELRKTPGKYDASKFYLATIESYEHSEPDPNVGIGDLKEALMIAKQKNPKMTSTLYTGACFSGSLARAFADVPDTQTFVASQAVLYAWGTSEGTTPKSNEVSVVAYDEIFQRALRRGDSYNNAHTFALEEYLKSIQKDAVEDEYLNSEMSASIPRSGCQEFLTNWCIMNREAEIGSQGDGKCF